MPLDSSRPLIMGILNVTPDSFSDGGTHSTADSAIEHAQKMIENGADIIDIGGESTRPGADPVSAEDEANRVLPVIAALAKSKTMISIDTMKAKVAAQAVEGGAKIINDVSACSADPDMTRIVAESGAGVVLMHMKGEPRTMQAAPTYDSVVPEICAYLSSRTQEMTDAGVDRDSIMLDPGIGFGKTTEHNLTILAELEQLSSLDLPVLIGLSRKSFIGKITGRDVNERLAGSLAGLIWCILKGVHVLRVHDIPQTLDAVKIIEALKEV